MKNILLVDDDQDALTRLVETFEVYETDCNVFTAENGEEATAVLQTKHIDCVLTDLRMPKMDGFQLIAYMSRVCSQIPVIVMTGFGTPEIESKIRNMSKVQYMEKPVDFDLLIDLLHKVMRSESGFIKGIALPHFLQLLEMENKTCTLSISCELKQGSLYFINGKLINARYGKYEGKEAAFEIVTWEKNVEIAMSDKCHLREKQIQETLGYILLEGFHLKDANQLLSPQNVDVHEDKEPIIEPLTVSEGLHNEISRLMVILGDSLLATEIYRVSDGNSIAAHSTGNQYKANFHTLAIKTDESLKTSGFPGLGRYVLLKLKRNQIAMIILLGDYQWGLLLDSKKTKLGLLLNIILPEITRGFKQWIEG